MKRIARVRYKTSLKYFHHHCLSCRAVVPAILIEYLVIAVIILVIGGYFVWQAADRLRYVYGCSDAPRFPCTPEESEKRIQARTTDLTIQFLGTLATVGSLLYITIWKGRRAKLKSH